MITLAFLMMSLAAVYALNHRLRNSMQVYQAETFLDLGVDDLHVAMARALSLLETENPDPVPFDCKLALEGRAGAPVLALSYALAASTWTVSVSSQDVSALAFCPSSF